MATTRSEGAQPFGSAQVLTTDGYEPATAISRDSKNAFVAYHDSATGSAFVAAGTP